MTDLAQDTTSIPFESVDLFLKDIVSEEDRLLVAVSGGADSMGLLGLLRLSWGWPAERLVAGHVDHGTRSLAAHAADWQLVREFAARLEVAARQRTVDVQEERTQNRQSLEVAARKLRYRALTEMARAEGCRWILTAHTTDDSAETVLMRMLGGAPWYEWTGIPARRGMLLRPLLSVRRSELRSHLTAADIPFREDESNSDTRFMRNRLRAELAERPDFWTKERMARLAESGETLREGMDALMHVAKLWVRASNRGAEGGMLGLAIDEIFCYFNKLTFAPVEAAWVLAAGLPQGRLSSSYRRQITDLLTGRSPHARIILPHGILLLRYDRKIWLTSQSNAVTDELVVGEGQWSAPDGSGILILSRRTRDASCSRESGSLLSRAILERNLVLRQWRPGERMKLRGRPAKKVVELLGERGVNPAARPRRLVLADDAGPLAIAGGPVAERALPKDDDTEVTVILWKDNIATRAGHDI